MLSILVIGLLTSIPSQAIAKEEKELNIYFWFEFLPEPIINQFEKETGIDIKIDAFESMSAMEAKLLAGSTGYDIIIPNLAVGQRLLKVNALKKLDKNKLPNLGNLDPEIMSKLAKVDPGNNYGVPYAWGTMGIIFNVDLVKKRLPDVDNRSWDLFFKPENISKLSDCGVAFVDEYSEIIPIVLNYLGLDPNSSKSDDLNKAESLLKGIRPYIRHFNIGAIIEELATGELCAAITWNGEAWRATAKAEELKNGIVIDYSLPKEGTTITTDFLSIPADAKHPDNAHKFLNFLMRPDVIAQMTNTFGYPNGNAAATAYVLDEIKQDPDTYPPKEVMEKLISNISIPKEDRRKYTRLWTKFKAKR